MQYIDSNLYTRCSLSCLLSPSLHLHTLADISLSDEQVSEILKTLKTQYRTWIKVEYLLPILRQTRVISYGEFEHLRTSDRRHNMLEGLCDVLSKKDFFGIRCLVMALNESASKNTGSNLKHHHDLASRLQELGE